MRGGLKWPVDSGGAPPPTSLRLSGRAAGRAGRLLGLVGWPKGAGGERGSRPPGQRGARAELSSVWDSQRP